MEDLVQDPSQSKIAGGPAVTRASAIRLTKTQRRVIDWMQDGDRALYKCPFDGASYGHGNYGSDKWTRICSRKVVEQLIALGLVEWFNCHPPDLRAMLVLHARVTAD